MKRACSVFFFVMAGACVLMPYPESATVRDVLVSLGAMAGFAAMGLIAWEAGS